MSISIPSLRFYGNYRRLHQLWFHEIPLYSVLNSLFALDSLGIFHSVLAKRKKETFKNSQTVYSKTIDHTFSAFLFSIYFLYTEIRPGILRRLSKSIDRVYAMYPMLPQKYTRCFTLLLECFANITICAKLTVFYSLSRIQQENQTTCGVWNWIFSSLCMGISLNSVGWKSKQVLHTPVFYGFSTVHYSEQLHIFAI